MHCSPGHSSPSFQILVMNPGFYVFCKGTLSPVKPCFFRYPYPIFDMKQATYESLPQFYTFKWRDERKRILYKNFIQAGQDVKEMIKDALNKRGIFACPLFLYNPCILHFRDKYSNLPEPPKSNKVKSMSMYG